MKKIVQKTVLSLIALTSVQSVMALDSGSQKLGANIGATDYFKISCTGDTQNLNFKLLENGIAETVVISTPETKPVVNTTENKPVETQPIKPIIETTNPPEELPQFLNATLTKVKLKESIHKLLASTAKEMTLKGGNGSYILKIDTIGTNADLKTPQTYSVKYQCLNAAGKVTAGSSTVNGSLANEKSKIYTIKCNKGKTTGNTSYLTVKITNKTAITKMTTAAQVVQTTASGTLMAQVVKGISALNTIGEIVTMQGGVGDYFVMVNSPVNGAKDYSFQYSCLNASGEDAKTAPMQILQDQ